MEESDGIETCADIALDTVGEAERMAMDLECTASELERFIEEMEHDRSLGDGVDDDAGYDDLGPAAGIPCVEEQSRERVPESGRDGCLHDHHGKRDASVGGGVLTPRDIGTRGEKAAARYLETRGYEIIERNWRCRYGEADIVARDVDTLVFVEVKTRRGIDQGIPEEAVDAGKRSRYERIAACYLATTEEMPNCPVRFDVIGLLVIDENEGGGRALLRHHINAFEGL